MEISRKARLAVLAMGLVILAPLVVMLGNCVASRSGDAILAPGADHDEIVQIGEHTMMLPRGSVGSRIHEWTISGTTAHLFEVDDAIFEPGSATLTPDGRVRIDRFARLMRHDPALRANISATGSDPATGQRDALMQAKIQQIRKELSAAGVGDFRVKSEPAATAAGAGSVQAGRPYIVVIVSKGDG
jgi:hypothetical protein